MQIGCCWKLRSIDSGSGGVRGKHRPAAGAARRHPQGVARSQNTRRRQGEVEIHFFQNKNHIVSKIGGIYGSRWKLHQRTLGNVVDFIELDFGDKSEGEVRYGE